MTAALIVLALLFAIPLIYLATLDGNYSVRQTLDITCPRQQVFDKVKDFKSWPSWSPWLMHEPDADLEFSENPDREGGWYSWNGERVGEGRIEHQSFSGLDSIEQAIEFVRPFKSKSRVWWEFEEIDPATTRVHWNMQGSMPFLLRFLAKKVPLMVAKDYDTGLYKLRAELVPGAEVPQFSFDNILCMQEHSALVIPFEGELEAMKDAMMAGYPALMEYIADERIKTTGPPLAIYHNVDPDKKRFVCDIAVPVAANTVVDKFEVKHYQGGNYYRMTLKGSYEFLELAWYQAFSHLQMVKLKPQLNRPTLEVYDSDPNAVADSNDIMTSLYIPVR